MQEINFGKSDIRMTMTSLVCLYSAAVWEPPLTEPNRMQRKKKVLMVNVWNIPAAWKCEKVGG